MWEEDVGEQVKRKRVMNMGLSEEEGAKYWDKEARSYNVKA